MKLVIVESPAKAQTINKYLGNDYKVMASVGHIRDLPSKDGEPVKIYTPIKAINIPIKLLIVGFSLSIKYANKTPNGTSVCTNKTAAEASIKFNPL